LFRKGKSQFRRSSRHAGKVSVTSEKLLVRAVLNDGAPAPIT
jgi:hypothetical protein